MMILHFPVILSLTHKSSYKQVTNMAVERRHLREIPEDSAAQIGSDTMIGDRFVDVSSGRAAARIRPGGELLYQAQPELMRSLDLSQFEGQIRNVNALLDEIEEGRGRVGEFVVGEQMYRNLSKRVAETEAGFREAHDTASSVGKALYTDELYRRISDPILKLDQALARLQAGEGSGGRFLRDAAQYNQLQSSSADLRRSVGQLRAGSFLSTDEAYVGWERSLASIIRGVDDFNASPLLTSTHGYDNLKGAASDMTTTVREFRTDPKKFLRLKIF
jgi:phospholipid/cholesterol/gamma-HCH transport system substrate-binding protein